MTAPRWLDAEGVAARVSIRPDYVARYVKAGRLPPARYPFGRRQPRWDLQELDRWMTGDIGSTPHSAAVKALADEIATSAARRHANRP